MPVDFFQIVPNDPFVGQNNNNQKRSSSSPGQFDVYWPFFVSPSHFEMSFTGTQWSTLSHYLHHRRWIWCIQGSPGLSLSLNSVARILSIITKMRLQEGFSFAHSSSGIFTFLLELDMEVIKPNSKCLNYFHANSSFYLRCLRDATANCYRLQSTMNHRTIPKIAPVLYSTCFSLRTARVRSAWKIRKTKRRKSLTFWIRPMPSWRSSPSAGSNLK